MALPQTGSSPLDGDGTQTTAYGTKRGGTNRATTVVPRFHRRISIDQGPASLPPYLLEYPPCIQALPANGADWCHFGQMTMVIATRVEHTGARWRARDALRIRCQLVGCLHAADALIT